jgi:hypothetical protein
MIYLQEMPADQLRIIDSNVRMFTEPVFRGNTALLAQAYGGEIERKKKLLLRVSAPCIKCAGTGKQPDMISGVEGLQGLRRLRRQQETILELGQVQRDPRRVRCRHAAEAKQGRHRDDPGVR